MQINITHYKQLGKFRLSLLVVFTAAIGYGVAIQHFELQVFLCLLAGTLLCSMGANGLNQVVERKRDARMLRTANRPLPSGKMTPVHAVIVCSVWCILGLCLLFFLVNALTSWLAVTTILCYLLFYTPLKPHTSLAVLVGAIPGAIPPVMGWTAATNSFTEQAWVLGCLLYLWQIPHFMSLASLYRLDYQKGGFSLLPDNPQIEQMTRSIILIFSLALLGISLLLPGVGLGTVLFFYSALILGLVLISFSFKLYMQFSESNARKVFITSIVYLPVLMTVLLIDRVTLQ